MRTGDIVQHKITYELAVVCVDTICELSGQIIVYYAGMPLLSGMYPENAELIERTGLSWQQAAARMKVMIGHDQPA